MEPTEQTNIFEIDKNEPIVVGTFHPIPRDLELTKKETTEFIEGLKLFSNINLFPTCIIKYLYGFFPKYSKCI